MRQTFLDKVGSFGKLLSKLQELVFSHQIFSMKHSIAILFVAYNLLN